MITVHHLNNSRSYRVIWLLEELGIAYDLKLYQREPKTWRAPPEYKKLHPLGYSPIVTDNDFTLCESGAVIEYILYQYGLNKLKPSTGSPLWHEYNFWMHFAEGTFMPVLFLQLVLARVHKQSPFFIKPVTRKINKIVDEYVINPRLTNHLNYVESILEKNEWLLDNEFSAADIQMGFPLIWIANDIQKMQKYPQVSNYIERLKQRPALKRTFEKIGPLSKVD